MHGTDISELQRKRAATKLESTDELVMKLQTLDRHKDQFLASLAHELRSPLAPIQCALDSMGLMELSSEVEGLRKMMTRQVHQMVHLIDGLMDVSRIGCGKLVLEKVLVPLRAIVESAVEASSTFIEESEQILTVFDQSNNAFVFGDPTRLTQVITNLLNNAAKYSGAGSHIHLTLSEEDEFVAIRIRDDGIGIADHRLNDIFQLYSQGETSDERGPPGLGIGLSLVKTFVELHSGHVTVESKGIGFGSVFTVLLPSAEKPVDGNIRLRTTDEIATQQTRSFRVLVVEDQRALRMVLARLLERLGHTVEVADGGAQAISTLESFMPEVIFSDISMPDMNGYELVRKLRQCSETKSAYIVALTGSGSAIDRKAAIVAGFDEHLTKPIDILSLRRLFESLPPMTTESI